MKLIGEGLVSTFLVPEFIRNTVTHLANASDLLVVFVSQRRFRFIIHNYPAAPRESPPPARLGPRHAFRILHRACKSQRDSSSSPPAGPSPRISLAATSRRTVYSYEGAGANV